MTHVRSLVFASVVAGMFGTAPAAFAQSGDLRVEIVIPAGRPLRVALDKTVTVDRVGQPVSGTLIDDVYAYDRVVLHAGATVAGHVDQLISPSKSTRVRAMLSANFSPDRQVVIRFDTVAGSDGRLIPVSTLVTSGAERVRRQMASGDQTPKKSGVVADAQQRVTQRVDDAVSNAKDQVRSTLTVVKGPDKMERLKEAALNRLPVHPQYLHKGTIYSATLQAPVSFGEVAPVPRAPAGTTPAPDSILVARLMTSLDSAKTPRGTIVKAVITEPIFSAAHELIVPEGTTLVGEVTFAKAAEHWHRNGQIRFLFENIQLTGQPSSPLLGSLYSADVSQDAHVAIDDEGGARVTNSKSRFVAPVLSVLALSGSIDQRHRGRNDGDGDVNDLGPAGGEPSGNVGGRALGGFFGFGLIGAALSQISRPAGIAFAAVGSARTIYRNIVGKGSEMSFSADTAIQIRLAPGKVPKR